MTNEAGNTGYISAETVPSRARGYVYFIRVGERIKVGYSTWPAGRLLALQTANAGKLLILGTMQVAKEVEKDIHQRFAHLHVRGEWFEARSDLLQFIERFTPEGAAAKKARHQAEMPVGPPRNLELSASTRATVAKLHTGARARWPAQPARRHLFQPDPANPELRTCSRRTENGPR